MCFTPIFSASRVLAFYDSNAKHGQKGRHFSETERQSSEMVMFTGAILNTLHLLPVRAVSLLERMDSTNM